MIQNLDKIKALTANTDNKGKLFVTFFAFCSCYQDSFVPLGKPGPLHCPQ
jgi:hypothetical protein